MKKVCLLLVMILLLLASNMNAQQSNDYFSGKWELLVQGTPQGDIKMLISFERKDGKLEATIQDPNSSTEFKVTDIEEKEKSITLSFPTPDFEVTLYFEQVDDENLKGHISGMFDLKGKRVKNN